MANVYVLVGWGAVQGVYDTAQAAENHMLGLDPDWRDSFNVQKWPVA